MKLWIGTAGYSYRHWVGPFYPPRTQSDAMLTEYARQFPVVEINSSFYRPPALEQAQRMARRTPDGFGFTLKVPRTVSHEFSETDLPAFKLAAERLAEAGRLLGLLVQFAESFHNVRIHRAWVAQVRAQLWPFPLAVEFRHRSWDVAALPGWCERHGLDLVSVQVPGVPSLFPSGLRVAGRRVYARLHSEDAAKWYEGHGARYDYDFRDAVLQTWADGLARAASHGVEEATVFFNNTSTTHAVLNAKRLAELMAEVPGVDVIAPAMRLGRGLFDAFA